MHAQDDVVLGRVRVRQVRQGQASQTSLAVIDSPAPAGHRGPDDLDRADVLSRFVAFCVLRMGRSVTTSADVFRGQPPQRQLGEVVRQLRLHHLVSGDLDVQEIGRRVEIFASNLAAARVYRPAAYPGRVTLLRATDRPGRDAAARPVGGPLSDDAGWTDDDGVYGWSRLAAGGVAAADVPGTHHTLLTRPNVLALAAELRATWRRNRAADLAVADSRGPGKQREEEG